MTKITAGSINVYFGFSDDAVAPNALPLNPPENSLYIFTDKPQVWVAHSGQWTFLMPLNIALSVPFAGPSESISIPAPDGGTANRQVVALASNIAGQPMSGLEAGIKQLIELNTAQLTELRVANMLLQGLNTVPVADDLDQLRAFALTSDEYITR